MKPKELLMTGLAYLIGVTVIYLGSRTFYDDAAGLSQCVGTIIGIMAATWFYQSRNGELAPAKVKFAVGAILAALAAIQGLAFQSLFKWMRTPDIAIFAGVLGAFIFTFALWNTFGQNVVALKKK